MVIVKAGGGRAVNLDGLAEDLAGLGEPVILVHGANAFRDDLAGRLGVPLERLTSASGYESRLTDEGAMDVLLMAYAGLRNKRAVEALQQRGVRAVGLSGLDGPVVRGRRNRGIRSREGDKIVIRRDLSAKPFWVNEPLLRMLLEAGYTPVLTVPIADEQGTAVNSENDDIVALLHGVFRAHAVIQLIEAPGLMADPEDLGSAIPRLTPAEVGHWEQRAEGRFKRKLHAIGTLFAAAPTRLIIADGRSEHPIVSALEGKGTVIQ